MKIVHAPSFLRRVLVADAALSSVMALMLILGAGGYPATNALGPESHADTDALAESGSIAVPLRIRMGDVVLSFISTTTIFGTPLDITLSELALETFFFEDQVTAAVLAQLSVPQSP